MVLIALLGCLGHAPPVKAPRALELGVVGVVDSVREEQVEGAPVALTAAIERQARLRGLSPTLADVSALLPAFQRQRDSHARAAAVPLSGDATLIVETTPAFYSEMNGKYRWTVAVTLTLLPTDRVERFDVPVFLQYHHEREQAAVAAATPVVARRVGQLLDAWLSAP